MPYLNSQAEQQYRHVFSACKAMEYRHSYFTQSLLIQKVEEQTIFPSLLFHLQRSKTAIITYLNPSLSIHRVEQQNITFSPPTTTMKKNVRKQYVAVTLHLNERM